MEKSGRLNIRVSEEQHSILRRAAEAAGQTLSDYVLSRMLTEAETELVDRRVFALDAEAWRELDGRVARPGTRVPELRRLLRAPAPWATDPVEAQGEAPVVDLMQALEASLTAAKWAGDWRIIVAPKSSNVVVISDDDDDVATA